MNLHKDVMGKRQWQSPWETQNWDNNWNAKEGEKEGRWTFLVKREKSVGERILTLQSRYKRNGGDGLLLLLSP